MMILLCIIGLLFGLGVVFVAGLLIGAFLQRNWVRVVRRVRRILHLNVASGDVLYPVMSSEQSQKIRNAIRLNFCGDFILLRDMVEDALDAKTGRYEFTEMFASLESYFKDPKAFTIGVLEGPVAGNENGRHYSNSVFSDGIPIHLNFPESYATAIRDAGVNLVTLATNHLFDYGESGLRDTVATLNRIGLDYVGAYCSQSEKDQRAIRLIDIGGKKAVVLSYTFCSGGRGESPYFDAQTSFYTSPLAEKKSRYFKECRASVAHDFDRAKKLNPDVIIVLPHIGREFRHKPDRDQKWWYHYFIELGADVVLGDHPHAVQPIEWVRKGDVWKVIVYCPGNFINSYTKADGDASMMTSIYLDVQTGKPFASACVPIYAYGLQRGNYKAVCLDSAMADEAFLSAISKAEYKRMAEVQEIVTKSAFGTAVPLHNHQREYVTFPGVGYVRQPVRPLADLNVHGNSCLLRQIMEAQSVCFVGDSITEGTKNGGYGWYEPIVSMLTDKKIHRVAKGGETTKWLRAQVGQLANAQAELYVVAIGCNDVRYRDAAKGAMTGAEYVANLEKTVAEVEAKWRKVKWVFLAPWRSRFFDPFCPVPEVEKWKIYDEYSKALESFCEREGHLFLDPNGLINQDLEGGGFLVDHVHPDGDRGIRRFAEASLTCRHVDGGVHE